MFKKKEITVPCTMVRCGNCSRDIKRPHAEGDYVCMESGCPGCGHAAHICGIFGEKREE